MELPDAEIAETEVVVLLNNNPLYRDLQSRLAFLEANRTGSTTTPPCRERSCPPGSCGARAEYDATKAQIEELESSPAKWFAAPSGSPWSRRSAAWKARMTIPPSSCRPSKRKSRRKGNEADSVGRSSVAAQMARAEVENIERILHGVAEERERLRVELRSQHRVKCWATRMRLPPFPKTKLRDFRYLVHSLRIGGGHVHAGHGHRHVGPQQGANQFRRRRVETAENPGDRGGAA